MTAALGGWLRQGAEAAHAGGGQALRVVMLDPNSHTLPYDQALAQALVAEGCTVEFVAAPFLYEDVLPPAGVTWRPDFFRLMTAPGFGGRGAARSGRLRRALKAVEYPWDWARLLSRLTRQPPDIVHVQWALAPRLEARIWRWLQWRGVPVVYTAHNLLPHARAPGDAARYAVLYQTADAIIVHTQTTAATLEQRWGIPPARLHVAPHGPLLEAEPAIERATARRRLGLPVAAPLIVFVGLIEPYKGMPDLAQAFAQLARDLPEARLVIAGRPNMRLDAVLAPLRAAGVMDRVHLDLRFLPQATLAAYLCAADVVALPYREVTASGTLLAAWRFGCPVVVTAVGDLAELVEDEVTGLQVPPMAPAALAAALRRLLEAPALRARLGAAGRSRVETRLSWSMAARRTVAAYRDLRRRVR